MATSADAISVAHTIAYGVGLVVLSGMANIRLLSSNGKCSGGSSEGATRMKEKQAFAFVLLVGINCVLCNPFDLGPESAFAEAF